MSLLKKTEHLENKNISGITSLVMASCNIKQLNVKIFHSHIFHQIRILRLDQNRITSLPEKLFHFFAITHIEELNLKYNELGYLSQKQYGYLLSLHTLHLDYNKFRAFEGRLFVTNKLRYLALHGNAIVELPDDFFAGSIHRTLKTITIDRNKLKGIPYCLSTKSTIQDFPSKLEALSLVKNSIRQLPMDWFNSTNWSFLRYLDLSFNQLETLPQYIFYSSSLSRLELLKFSHNRISFLSEELFNSSYLKNIKKIDFSHNNIAYLSENLFHSTVLQNLQEINFSHNNITYLSEKLFYSTALQNLEEINFSHNHISVLPDKLFQSLHVQNLHVIDLSYNQLNSLPLTFLKNQALENLIRISLNNNNIKSVPVDMLPVKFLNLCDINLANNKISSIGEILPKVLQNMKHANNIDDIATDHVLRQPCKLDLSKNALTVQRTNFIELNASEPHLLINATLDLSDNNIGKFEVISLFLKRLGSQEVHFITVPLKTKWLFISGNRPFSIKNLVQAALNIDLDQEDPGFGIYPYNFVKELFRLHVLIQAFPYEYDCNCDMIKCHFSKRPHTCINTFCSKILHGTDIHF